MNIEKMKQILKRNASDPWFMDNQWIYFGPMDEPIESSANYVMSLRTGRAGYSLASTKQKPVWKNACFISKSAPSGCSRRCGWRVRLKKSWPVLISLL
jgi:hypothetical protein